MASVPRIERLDDAGTKEFNRAYRMGVPEPTLKLLTSILLIDSEALSDEIVCPMLSEWINNNRY